MGSVVSSASVVASLHLPRWIKAFTSKMTAMSPMRKFFNSVGRIEYRPDAGPEDTLVYRHYNPSETVHGRTMEEWLRFSPCYFNMFRYFGTDNHYGYRTQVRPWDEGYSWTMQHGRPTCPTGYPGKGGDDPMVGKYMEKGPLGQPMPYPGKGYPSGPSG